MRILKPSCKNRVVWAALFLLLFGINANAQHRSDHWYFGDSAAIHFTDSGVVATTDGQLHTREGCATISDTSGNLLFYTNGWRIWNRNDNIMPNGDSIVNWISESEYENLVSVTQSAIILPYPQHEGQYIVFSNPTNMLITYPYHPPVYSIVDMSMDSGLGDVVNGYKSISLIDSTAALEKMQAVKHANGRDWWILVMGYDITGIPGWAAYGVDSSFLRFLLTPDGVEYLGDQHIGYTHNFIDRGEMVFTQKGDKLAIAGMLSLEVREFDRCSGLIGPRILLDLDYGTAYGVAFSPDGSKLYVSGYTSKLLWQYNLSAGDQDSTYKQIVFSDSDLYLYAFGQLELGSDGFIYLPIAYDTWPNNVYDQYTTSLTVIKHPNLVGPACGIDTLAIDLLGKRCVLSLPNQPNYELGALTGSPCDTLGTPTEIGSTPTEQTGLFVFPQPATGVLTVIIPEFLESELQIEVFDRLGRLSHSEIIESWQYSYQINVQNLTSGIYILKLTDEAGISISKAISIE